MTESEREMLRPSLAPTRYQDAETSLQPTYEDSVEPDSHDDADSNWEES